MNVRFTLNGDVVEFDAALNDTLLAAPRRQGLFGVSTAAETGECGACVVLLDGAPVTSCVMLASQADGRDVVTIEARRQQERGWRGSERCTRSRRLLWKPARSSAATARRA